jgi:excisionase family DNA binding protein
MSSKWSVEREKTAKPNEMSSVVDRSTALAPGRGRCAHASFATAIDVVDRARGPKLRRHTCGYCHRSWWERDGVEIDVRQALALISQAAGLPRAAPRKNRPSAKAAREELNAPCSPAREPVPAGFVALLGWVAHAIGTRLVVFAVTGQGGWHTVTLSPAPAAKRRPGSECQRTPQSGVLDAMQRETLLNAVAQLRVPSVLPKGYLATNFPEILGGRVASVVAASLCGADGEPRAVIMAAYEGTGAADMHRVSPAAVGTMGKLLATAYRRLCNHQVAPTLPPVTEGRESDAERAAAEEGTPRSLPPPLAGDPDDLMRPNEVAAIFGVHPRSINNWVSSGTLVAVHTLGGHIRIRRGDVADLYLSKASGTS